MDQHLAEQFRRHDYRRPVIEAPGQGPEPGRQKGCRRQSLDAFVFQYSFIFN
jgi:hypothetical protein